MNDANNYPVGCLVKHKNRLDVSGWVVICSGYNGAHLLRSIPDQHGCYEVIRGDMRNLELLLGMAASETSEGKRCIATTR